MSDKSQSAGGGLMNKVLSLVSTLGNAVSLIVRFLWALAQQYGRGRPNR